MFNREHFVSPFSCLPFSLLFFRVWTVWGGGWRRGGGRGAGAAAPGSNFLVGVRLLPVYGALTLWRWRVWRCRLLPVRTLWRRVGFWLAARRWPSGGHVRGPGIGARVSSVWGRSVWRVSGRALRGGGAPLLSAVLPLLLHWICSSVSFCRRFGDFRLWRRRRWGGRGGGGAWGWWGGRRGPVGLGEMFWWQMLLFPLTLYFCLLLPDPLRLPLSHLVSGERASAPSLLRRRRRAAGPAGGKHVLGSAISSFFRLEM